MKLTIQLVLICSIFLTTIAPLRILAQEESVYSVAEYKSAAMLAPDNDSETIILQSSLSDEETLALVGSILPERQVKRSKRGYFIIKTSSNSIQSDLASLLVYGDLWSAEPNYIYEESAWTTNATRAVPDDYNATDNWNMDKIKLPEAYKLTGCEASANCGGYTDVVVAVLDTGVAFENYTATYDYTNLENSNVQVTNQSFVKSGQFPTVSLWQNPNETASNGVDDDGNYYCDDKNGADVVQFWDNFEDWLDDTEFANLCNTTSDMQKAGHPNDDHGHGTFVSNMIVGAVNDSASSFGISFNIKLMPVKVLDYTGSATTTWIADGIYYAVDEGADIINMSIVGGAPSSLIASALSYANSQDVLVVISSGNFGEGSTTPKNQLTYPAAYSKTYSNVMSVGATDPDNSLTSYSHYENGLSLVAPVGSNSTAGTSIKANTYNDAEIWLDTDDLNTRDFTLFNDRYWVGTSFAAPQVAAIAALVKGKNNHEMSKPGTIKSLLQLTATDINTGGYDPQTGYGIVNAENAWSKATDIFWSNWDYSMLMNGSVTMESFEGKVFQSITGSDGLEKTRMYNGTNWGAWQVSGASSKYNVTLASHGTKLFQSVTGSNGLEYTRIYEGSSWGPWTKSGASSTQDIGMMSLQGNKLFQSVKGSNNMEYTRIYSGGAWGPWTKSGASSMNNVSMMSMGTKLFQSVTGLNGLEYTRIYEGTNWGPWTKSGASSMASIEMQSFQGNKLFQAVKASNGLEYTRIYSGGVWGAWSKSGATTSLAVNMVEYKNQLFQSVTGSNGKDYTRVYNQAGFWGPWVSTGTGSLREVTMVNYNNTKLFQALMGSNNRVYTRSI